MHRVLPPRCYLAVRIHRHRRRPIPSRTVRLLCWTSAGAPLDVMMRQVGKQFGKTSARLSSSKIAPAAKAPWRWHATQQAGRRLHDPVDHLEHVVRDGHVGQAVHARRIHRAAGPAERAVRGRGAQRQPVPDDAGLCRVHTCSPRPSLGRRLFVGGLPSIRVLSIAATRTIQVRLGAVQGWAGRYGGFAGWSHPGRSDDAELSAVADPERKTFG